MLKLFFYNKETINYWGENTHMQVCIFYLLKIFSVAMISIITKF